MPASISNVIDLCESSDRDDGIVIDESCSLDSASESDGECPKKQELRDQHYENVVGESHHSTHSGRIAFKRLLHSMENPNDLKLLYPASLSLLKEQVGHNEETVLRELTKSQNSSLAGRPRDSNSADFEELQLRDIVVYRSIGHSKGLHGQMDHLHNFSSRGQNDHFLLDGILCCQGISRRVVGLEILDIRFGGLGDTAIHTTTDYIWIQTHESIEWDDLWYRVINPANEYASYWEASIWVSDFSKYVLEYLAASSKDIGLADFRHGFWNQIQMWYSNQEAFQAWHELCGQVIDFRKFLIRYTTFCWHQANGVTNQIDFAQVLGHPLWVHLAVSDVYSETASSQERTIVSQSIYSAFLEAFPAWGPRKFNLLQPVAIDDTVAATREKRRIQLGFPHLSDSFYVERPGLFKSVKKISKVDLLLELAYRQDQSAPHAAPDVVGKVAIVLVNPNQLYDRYKFSHRIFQYAWISAAISAEKVHVIWLMLPSDTICGHRKRDRTFYPVGNELFFTPSCEVIPVSRLVAVYDAAVFGAEVKSQDTILIRQIYNKEESTFTAARRDRFVCNCPGVGVPTAVPHCVHETEPSTEVGIPDMKNLSLFCGPGLLDFALREAAPVETVMAIDTSEVAVRSHEANSDPESCTHRIRSVNFVLERALKGTEVLPKVNCITAGSPCPGYSLANVSRFTIDSQRNCSLLTSPLSYIDLVLPEYAVIENIPMMDHTPVQKGYANACGQAICCLVALGYQVRKMELVAADYGNSTMRRRLFIVAAAPNCVLPKFPEITHGCSPGLQPTQTIGMAFSSLPQVHNDTQVNLKHTDHLPVARLKQQFILEQGREIYGISLRNLVRKIPKKGGVGLVQALNQGLLSVEEESWLLRHCSAKQRDADSRCLRRVSPDSLLPTIMTVVTPMDARIGGHIIHFAEDRTLTLQELRLAQGIPDWFLLVGNIQDQVKQIGNGIAWQAGVALGRSISKAWIQSVLMSRHQDGGDDDAEIEFVRETVVVGSRPSPATIVVLDSPTPSPPTPPMMRNKTQPLVKQSTAIDPPLPPSPLFFDEIIPEIPTAAAAAAATRKRKPSMMERDPDFVLDSDSDVQNNNHEDDESLGNHDSRYSLRSTDKKKRSRRQKKKTKRRSLRLAGIVPLKR